MKIFHLLRNSKFAKILKKDLLRSNNAIFGRGRAEKMRTACTAMRIVMRYDNIRNNFNKCLSKIWLKLSENRSKNETVSDFFFS
jgi:hypothetical protein